jgi:hypothetical protein
MLSSVRAHRKTALPNISSIAAPVCSQSGQRASAQQAELARLYANGILATV